MENLILEIVNGKQVTKEEALKLFDFELEEVFFAAVKIRRKYKNNKIKVCSIINAKSGQCSEDCKFCAQSAFNKTDVNVYSLANTEKIKEFSIKALENVGCFGIVSSGNSLSDTEVENFAKCLKSIRKYRIWAFP